MELRRDLLIGIGALVMFNILISFGTIGLLVRMSPAIERILHENVYSIQAAEDMLSVVARSASRPAAPAADDWLEALNGLDGLGGTPQAAAERARFAEALQRARSNITEEAEGPVLARIDKGWRAALEGEARARTEVVDALELLVRINREAMRAEDIEAQRLGMAGAWSAVFIAVCGFAISFAVTERLRRRILAPLAELYGVLESARGGDFYRRCKSVDAPLEIRRIFHVVNQLLDRQSSALERRQPGHGLDRVVMVHLLEQHAEPAFVMDGQGELLAANTQGLARLGAADGEQVRQALARMIDEGGRERDLAEGASERLRAVPVAGGNAWHCTLHARSSPGR